MRGALPLACLTRPRVQCMVRHCRHGRNVPCMWNAASMAHASRAVCAAAGTARTSHARGTLPAWPMCPVRCAQPPARPGRRMHVECCQHGPCVPCGVRSHWHGPCVPCVLPPTWLERPMRGATLPAHPMCPMHDVLLSKHGPCIQRMARCRQRSPNFPPFAHGALLPGWPNNATAHPPRNLSVHAMPVAT
eukprot:353713-Chlamydomonas_euryale.AAC.1